MFESSIIVQGARPDGADVLPRLLDLARRQTGADAALILMPSAGAWERERLGLDARGLAAHVEGGIMPFLLADHHVLLDPLAARRAGLAGYCALPLARDGRLVVLSRIANRFDAAALVSLRLIARLAEEALAGCDSGLSPQSAA